MIYIDVYYEDPLPGDRVLREREVKITYPNEEDFMKERRVDTIKKLSKGILKYEEGIYDQTKGFFPNSLMVEGIDQNYEHLIITLPMALCIIKKHYP